MFNLTENLAGAILNFDTCISISFQKAFSLERFIVDLVKKLFRLRAVINHIWVQMTRFLNWQGQNKQLSGH